MRERKEESNMKKKTEELLTDLKQCDSIDTYMKENSEEIKSSNYLDYFNHLLAIHNKTLGEIEKEALVPKSTLYSIYGGTRNGKKENIIKIGFSIGVNLSEMQQLLKLSHNQELYARNKRDSIIIYGLNQNMNIYQVDELLREYQEVPLLEENVSEK